MPYASAKTYPVPTARFLGQPQHALPVAAVAEGHQVVQRVGDVAPPGPEGGVLPVDQTDQPVVAPDEVPGADVAVADQVLPAVAGPALPVEPGGRDRGPPPGDDVVVAPQQLRDPGPAPRRWPPGGRPRHRRHPRCRRRRPTPPRQHRRRAVPASGPRRSRRRRGGRAGRAPNRTTAAGGAGPRRRSGAPDGPPAPAGPRPRAGADRPSRAGQDDAGHPRRLAVRGLRHRRGAAGARWLA